jgi:hypothetical protein
MLLLMNHHSCEPEASLACAGLFPHGESMGEVLARDPCSPRRGEGKVVGKEDLIS